MTSSLVLTLGALVLGAVVSYLVQRYFLTSQGKSVDEKVQNKLDAALKQAKELVHEAEGKANALLLDARNEEKERKSQLATHEARVINREELLDKKLASIDDQEKTLRTKNEELKTKEGEVDALRDEAIKRLEKMSGLSHDEARAEIIRQIKEKGRDDLAQMMQKMEREGHEELEKRAGDVITVALQRYARSHVSELTTAAFPITDDEMKGKIIGREGRNIRALERATGVEFIIDETPDTVIISSFDPYRREVAKMALGKLVKDGRIQPAKIEEKVEESKQELQKRIQEIGEAAAMELGIYDFPKEILQLLGRLHFRTSYGQNVLIHSTEMAYISAMMASELGLNVEVAKRGALVHDIGKAIDHDVEGTHVELGMKILRKYNVPEAIVQAMQSHHEDYPYAIPEAYVVTAADVLSAARPGARRDTVENYIKRLGDLERLANEFPGVKQSYAISAGRELRVFVIPEKVDDFRALELAREIANRIQSELKYPGEIKVNIIREVRAVEYAR